MTTPICPDCGSVRTKQSGRKERSCDDCGYTAPARDFKQHAIRPEGITSGSRRVERAPTDQDELP